MTWSIVHFKLDNSVEVVPKEWIKKNGHCAWPKKLKINDIKKAIYNKVKINKFDFNYFEARCLANNIGKHN